MRQRIALLVAATTSAVVLAFVIPLALLVRTMAADRALVTANDEARSAAILVSGLHDDPGLGDLIAQVDQRTPPRTSVLMPDGTVLGAADPEMAEDPEVVLATQGEAFTRLDDRGAAVLSPVATEDGTFVVRTTLTPEELRSGVYRAWVSIGLLGLLLLGLSLAIAVRLGKRISTPVTDLAAVAERLQRGELDARATPEGPPETVELAETMNRLAGRIEELLVAERAAVGDLSHRLRTPVTALRLDADAVGEPELADRLRSHVEQLQASIDAIVRDARRPLHTALEARCDAIGVVRDRVAFWSALAEDQQRPVTVALPAVGTQAVVGLAESELTDAVDVLVDNVFAHTPETAALRIGLEVTSDQVVLEVRDEGPGLALDRGTQDRPGSTGLGLDLARRTAARGGGRLEVSDASPGVRIRLVLPRH